MGGRKLPKAPGDSRTQPGREHGCPHARQSPVARNYICLHGASHLGGRRSIDPEKGLNNKTQMEGHGQRQSGRGEGRGEQRCLRAGPGRLLFWGPRRPEYEVQSSHSKATSSERRLDPFRKRRECVSSRRNMEGGETVRNLNHREKVAHPTVGSTDIIYRAEKACRGLQKSLRQPRREPSQGILRLGGPSGQKSLCSPPRLPLAGP